MVFALLMVVAMAGCSSKTTESPTSGKTVSVAPKPTSAHPEVKTESEQPKEADSAQTKKDALKALSDLGVKTSTFLGNLKIVIVDDNLTTDGLIQPKILMALKKVGAIGELAFEGNSGSSHGTRITDAGLAQLKELVDCEEFNLFSASKITDAGIVAFATNKKLTRVGLSDTNITDAALVHLKNVPKLKKLFLQRCKGINGKGLEQLKGSKELEELYLQFTPITDEGLERIGRITSLKELYLGGSVNFDSPEIKYPFTDKGLNDLSGLSELSTLAIISCPQITDKGLLALKRLGGLSDLSLDRTAITDKGLASLEAIPKLKFVSLQDTKVTKDGVAKLKKAVPNLTVRVN
jgi:hypothetical protein